MKILLTGLAGSGKTTCRLQLRSLLPHYVFYVRNIEGEASIYHIGESVPELTEDLNLDVARQLCARHSNVVLTIARYAEVPLEARLAPDISVYVHCNLVQRIERLLARDPSLTIEAITEYISTEPIDIEYEMTCDYSFDTTGDRSLLTQTLIDFVDQHSLRPAVWDESNPALMKQLYL